MVDHLEAQRQLRCLVHVSESDGAVGPDLRRWQIEGHRHLEPKAAFGVRHRQPSLRLRRVGARDQNKQRKDN